ncbi:5-hydroxytryptamine receptor 1B-like [Paramacrobiotus metropolitanus]|uniref:5-hydroxytryptamine receptor 1B-like n=1 Tax=Paramacrobiotus metropolitanus TaxID=2943436 RepID=UPI002445C6FE|nr:5-hydroxytryptamine receptor 1B-like [Paramacrobiotus metropolitanus]
MPLNYSHNTTPAISLALGNTEFFLWTNVVFVILVAITNGFVMVLFTRHENLRTPFMTYIIFLLGSNILANSVIMSPVDALKHAGGYFWMGSSVCTYYLYGSIVVTSVTSYSHLLITLNRVWAIVFPISYREYHTRRMSVIICVVTVFILHFVALPLVLVDHWLYRIDEAVRGCNLNPDVGVTRIWGIVLSFPLFVCPLVCIQAAYPFIVYKRKQATKLAVHMTARTGDASSEIATNQRFLPRKHGAASSRGFVALTFMTASILLCWTPPVVYWTLVGFSGLEINTLLLDKLGWFMYQVQALVDPVLFTICLTDLRKTAKTYLCLQFCRA